MPDSQFYTGIDPTQVSTIQQDTQARLDALFNGVVDTSRPNIVQPAAPQRLPQQNEVDPSRNININDSDFYDRLGDMLMQDLGRNYNARNNVGAQNRVDYTPEIKRFNEGRYGYTPNADNEDFYAAQDWWIPKVGKFFGRFALGTVAKVGQGFSYLGGLVSESLPGGTLWDDTPGSYISAAGDNAFVKFFDHLDNEVKNDLMPVYQAASNRDQGFFYRALHDSTFWTNEFADGAAFMASAFAPGLGITKLGLGARFASTASRLAEGLAIGENSVLGAAEWGTKVSRYLQNADKVKSFVDKGSITLLNTLSESMFEASGVRDEVVSDLKGKVNPNTGIEYTQDEINEIAGVAARNTFLGNALALSASNFWEAGLIYKALGKEVGRGGLALGRTIRGGLGQELSLVNPTGLAGILNTKAGYYGLNAAKGIVAEGLWEENIQLAIQRQNTGKGKYNGILEQYLNQSRDAFSGDDNEASMNIGMGALFGGLFGAGSSLLRREYSNLKTRNEQLIKNIQEAENNWTQFGDFYERGEDGQLVQENGAPKINQQKLIAYAVTLQNIQQSLSDADQLPAGTMQDIAKKFPFASFVLSNQNAGTTEQMYEKLRALRDAKPEQLISLGLDPQSVQQGKLDEYISLANDLVALNDSIENDVLLRSNPRNAQDREDEAGRRSELYYNGAKQLIIRQSIANNDNKAAALKARMTAEGMSATDLLVDQYNTFTYRIQGQQALLNAADQYTEDGVDIDTVSETENLNTLIADRDLLVQNNSELFRNIPKNGELYRYENSSKLVDIFNSQYQQILKENALLTNSVKTLNDRWYKYADINGLAYYRQQKNRQVEALNEEAEQLSTETAIQEQQANPNAKTKKVKTTLSSGEEYSFDITEGEDYIGRVNEETRKTRTGRDITVFNNDHIRVVTINDDGTITVSINGDAAVDLTEEEFASIGRLTAVKSLTPVQRFYLKNRNKAFFYQVPVGKGKGQYKIVQGRLSLNKEKDTLMVTYEGNKKIAFNPKFLRDAQGNQISISRAFDLMTLPTEDEKTLQDQEAKLRDRYNNQVKYIIQLIDKTELDLNQQKQRTSAIQDQIDSLQLRVSRTQQLITELQNDNRSKKSLQKAIRENINTLKSELEKSESLLADLKQEQTELLNRQEVLQLTLDNYNNFYDELANNDGLPVNIDAQEQGRLQNQINSLSENENRNSEDRLYSLLEDTENELDLVNDRINVLQDYIDLVKGMLRDLGLTDRFLNFFTGGPSSIQGARVALRSQIASLEAAIQTETDPNEIASLNLQATEAKRLMRLVMTENPDAMDNFKAINKFRADLAKANAELTPLLTRLQGLKEKENRLIDAINNKSQLAEIRNRLNYIKDIYNELIAAYERERVAAGVFQSGQKVNVKNPNNAQDYIKPGAQVFDEDPSAGPLEVKETLKPSIKSTGLFKTAGSHFPGGSISNDEATQRFYKFTSDTNISQGFLLKVVTQANNAANGNILYVNDTAGYPAGADIKLVVVRRDANNKLVPVDLQGNPLTGDIKAQGIYTSMFADQQLLQGDPAGKRQWARNTFYDTANMSDNEIDSYITAYLTTRQNIIDAVARGEEVTFSISNKANGIENKVERNAEGKFPQLPLEGRVVPEGLTSDGWKTIALRVATAVEGKSVNVDGRQIAAGRLTITDTETGNVFQVYNRKFNKAEVKNIARAIVKYANLNALEIAQLTNPEEKRINESQRNLLYEYLYSVLYWNKPVEGQKTEDISPKQFWLQNGLHIGNALFIPSSAITEENLTPILEDLYHQVTSSRLSKDAKNEKFYEPIFKDDGGMDLKTWDSYKEYLMSSDNRTAPLYTNVVEKSDSITQPQFKNAYLTYSVPDAYKQQITPPPAANQSPRATQPLPTQDYTNLASLDNIPRGEKFVVTIVGRSGNIIEVGMVNDNGVRKVTSYNAVTPDGKPFVNANAEAAFREYLGPDQGDILIDSDYRSKFTSVTVRPEIVEQQAPQELPPAPVTPPATQTVQTEVATTPAPTQPQPSAAPSDYANLNALMSYLGTSSPDDLMGGYDMEVNREAFRDADILEDIDAFKGWMKERLPQIPVEVVDQLINNKAWGAVAGSSIVLYNNAEVGTGYHEAFEVIWKMYLDDTQRDSLTDEFRAREGQFTNPFTGETKAYSQASEYDAREMMAEEFRDFVLNDGKTLDRGRPKKNSIFRKIWNFIKSLFGLSVEDSTSLNSQINEIYRKIEEGYFANKEPNNFSSIAYRAIPGLSQYATNQILEGVHSIFFGRLFAKNENIEALTGKDPVESAALTNQLFAETKQRLTQVLFEPIAATIKGVNEGRVDAKALAVADARAKEVNDIVNKFYSDIVPIYKDHLSRFGLEFSSLSDKETQALQEKEGRVTDPLGILDSIHIDSRNLAAASIRLLIAALADSRYATNKEGKTVVVPRLNEQGFPKLVDYGKVLNTLLNELQGSVAHYENGVLVSRLDTMFNRLDSKYFENGKYRNGFLWIRQLKLRLKYAEDNNGTLENIDRSQLNENDIRFITAFEKSFSNNKNLPVKLIVGADGKIYATDPIVTANVNRLREEWRNNAKVSASGASMTLLINDQAEIIMNKKALLNIQTSDLDGKLKFLSGMGIELSTPRALMEQKGSKYFTKLNTAIQAIRSQLALPDSEIRTFDDLFGRRIVNGPINTLVEIEMAGQPEADSLQYFNPNGEAEYSITLPSLYSNLLNSLKSVTNLADFIRTNPQLGSVKDGVVTLNPYQRNSNLLKLDGRVFDRNGNKRASGDINYRLISGISEESENNGARTADMKFPDKIAQELYHILNGTYFTVINSDKSSEFGIDLGHFVDYKTIVFTDNIIQDHYIPHLIDELNAAVYNRNKRSNIQYYKDQVEQLGHFRNILNKSKANLEDVLSGKTSVEDFANSAQVKSDIKAYINKFVEQQKEELINNGIITKVQGGWKTSYISKEQLAQLGINGDTINDGAMDNLLSFIFINHNIAVREQHKIIYSHPAQYKDLPKRSNGVTSTKEQITENPQTIAWLDINKPRHDGVKRFQLDENGNKALQTFRVASYRDNEVASRNLVEIAEGIYESMSQTMSKQAAEKAIGAQFDENGKVTKLTFTRGSVVAAYDGLNEADAQAYGMPDFYRDILFLSAKWSDKQEKQWNYEMAYERLVRSGIIPNAKGVKLKAGNPAFKNFYNDGVFTEAYDRTTYEKGSPGAILPTLKPQFFGYQVNTEMMHTTFLKHSLKPLFWREVEGRGLETLYLTHHDNKVDIIGYESGEKVGNILGPNGSFTSMYSGAQIGTDLAPVQELYTRDYGIQVEMAAKAKQQVIIGSQMRKLLLSNLLNNGVPVTPEVTEKIEQYIQTVNDMINLGKESLIDELGLIRNEDGSYETEDLSRLLDTLRREAISRDLPDNIVESLATMVNDPTKLAYKFDTLPIREKIDNILNSIADSRVIAQKIHGKASVQVAASGYETSDRDFLYLNDQGIYEVAKYADLTDEQKKTAKMASSDLKFYTLENGKISAMEVMLPWYFEELVKEVDIKQLDPRLLQAIGFRIPTQALSQIDNIVIKGFLPKELGDMIVVPSEMVGKSGSDFDIDKLNIYLANYYTQNGKAFYIEPGTRAEVEARARELYVKQNKLGSTDIDMFGNALLAAVGLEDLNETQFVRDFYRKSLENQLIERSKALLELPQNYRQLMIPNSAATLQDLEVEVLGLKNRTKDKVDPTGLGEWRNMAITRLRFIVGKQLVGIGAIHVTSHTMSQLGKITLTGDYNVGGQSYPIQIALTHNEKGGLRLDSVTTADGQWISELLSEAMTGFVDAAKDPFVFELNINFNTASTYFYLMKLGVPMSTNVYFHTQPIIEQYVKNIDRNNSIINNANGLKGSKDQVKFQTLDPYYQVLFGVTPSELKAKQREEFVNKARTLINDYKQLNPNYTNETLRTAIKDLNQPNHNITRDEAIQQIAILDDYVDYTDQAGNLSTFVNAIGYDTKSTKNIIENVLQQISWNNVLQQGFIANPNDILDATFLRAMKDHKDDVPNMFKEYFVVLNDKMLPALNMAFEYIQNRVGMGSEDKANFLNRYQNYLINYIIHTSKVLDTDIDGKQVQYSVNNYYHLLRDSNTEKSFAKQLQEYKKLYPNNLALRELYPIIATKRTSTDNIKMFSTKMATSDMNVLIDSIKELRDQAIVVRDPNLYAFAKRLAIFSMIQGGVQISPISFNKVLPVELYSNIVSSAIDRFINSDEEVNAELIWKQFFQNNYKNPAITPIAKAVWLEDRDEEQMYQGVYGVTNAPSLDLKLVNDTSRYYNLPFFTIKQTKNLDRATLESLVANKQWDEIYNYTLYQRVGEVEGSNQALFKPINKLGNGMYAVEVYNQDTSAMTPNQLPNSTITGGYVEESSNTNISQNYRLVEQNNLPLQNIEVKRIQDQIDQCLKPGT